MARRTVARGGILSPRLAAFAGCAIEIRAVNDLPARSVIDTFSDSGASASPAERSLRFPLRSNRDRNISALGITRVVYVVAAISASAPAIAQTADTSAGASLAPTEHEIDGRSTRDGGADHLFRPSDPAFLAPFEQRARAKVRAEHPHLSEDSDEFRAAVSAEVQPVLDLADGLMKDLVCLCGGCSRIDLYTSSSGYAASRRKRVLEILSRFDLLEEGERERGYEAVIASFVEAYGGTHVLSMPLDEGFNRLAWLVPYSATAGALLLLVTIGGRTVRRSKRRVERATPTSCTPDDRMYDELLDEELRELD